MALIVAIVAVVAENCLAGDEGNWLAAGAQLAQADEKPDSSVPPAQTAPPATTYVPWRERVGPAYPGDFWRSFGRYSKELPETLWDDTKVTFTSPFSWVCFGLAGAAGIALNGHNGDAQIADHYTRHGSQLNSFWDSVGDAGGSPGTQFAITGAAYFISLARDDKKTYEVSTTMMNALIINGLFTEMLKVCVQTKSPNGDKYAWPSGHTSSSFCFATVAYDAYGPWVGVPLYGFATFVGYERIDARNHNFSDVISGALIGIAIGHAVAHHHQPKFLSMDVIPYVNPATGTVGIGLTKAW
jgi:hypothetical protein